MFTIERYSINNSDAGNYRFAIKIIETLTAQCSAMPYTGRHDLLTSLVSLVSKNGIVMNEPGSELERLLATYPETLTVADVATVLRVHERSVQRWAREGRVASVRVGRGYRFLRSDVLTLLHAARIHAHTAAPVDTIDRQPNGESV